MEGKLEKLPVTVVALNGPPRSGKDTIATMLATKLPHRVYVYSLAAPLKQALWAILGVNANSTSAYDLEQLKIEHRDKLISLSEDWVKPKLGKTWWAQRFVDCARRTASLSCMPEWTRGVGLMYVIPDLGFTEELEVLEENFARVIVVRMCRDGTTFEGDSRNYVAHNYMIVNNGTIEALGESVDALIKCLDAKVSKCDTDAAIQSNSPNANMT